MLKLKWRKKNLSLKVFHYFNNGKKGNKFV